MIALLVSCGMEEQTDTPKYQSAADQLLDEYKGTDVDATAVSQVLELSKQITLNWRSTGILSLIGEVKKQLLARGKSCSDLDQIEDYTIGKLLPGLDWTLAPEDTSDVGSKSSALNSENPNLKYWKCPPMDTKGWDSCVVIVDMAKRLALGNISTQTISSTAEKLISEDPLLKEQSAEFKDYAKTYLYELALQIHKFGIEVATVQAEWTLRQKGVCDNQVIDGKEIARLRGIEESTTVLRKLVGLSGLTLQPKGAECLKVGAYGSATDAKITSAIKSHIEALKKSDPFCPDMSSSNPNITEIYKAFEDGLRRGINAQLTTVWIGTFRNGRPWSIGGKIVVAKLDGCQAKDQINYTTSPLVLDLDNDGLQLTTSRVGFDLRATGEPQKVTWTGHREGFLALDLNKDGRINSGHELFGDRTLCGVDRCADGAEALAAHDQNGDGRIDASDVVFSSLGIWIDENQDGRTQAGELQNLASHGIKAFSLRPSYTNRELDGGKISLTLQVESSKGSMTAYDVWFHNQTSPGFSTPLF